MHIVISLLNFRPGLIGGAETYLRQLVPNLAAVLPAEDKLTILVNRDNADAITAPANASLAVVPLTAKSITRRRILEATTPWRDRLVEKFIRQLEPTVTLFPQQSIYPLRAPGTAVLNVVDLLHITQPKMVSPAERVFRNLIYGRSLKRAARVLAISKHVGDEIAKLTPKPAELIDVAPLGFTPPTSAGESANSIELVRKLLPADLAGEYLYYPAATHPHKNHEALFRCLAAMPESGRRHLVMTGLQTPHWDNLAKLAEQLGIADRLHPLGFVSYDEVQALYMHSHTVAFPSTHEGFGLPIVEAAYLGCRLITSDLPVFHETGVPDENRIDFDQPDAFISALQTLSKPTVLTKEPITWKQNAELTLRSLKLAAGESAA